MCNTYLIYTDGAYSPKRNQGGVGFVIIKDGNNIFSFKKMFRNTTNQRMEIMAACIALESLNTPSNITIFSDSAYLVNTMTKGWYRKSNLDLWNRLDKAVSNHKVVNFEWLKGHNNDPFNSEADKLATEASTNL